MLEHAEKKDQEIAHKPGDPPTGPAAEPHRDPILGRVHQIMTRSSGDQERVERLASLLMNHFSQRHLVFESLARDFQRPDLAPAVDEAIRNLIREGEADGSIVSPRG